MPSFFRLNTLTCCDVCAVSVGEEACQGSEVDEEEATTRFLSRRDMT